MTRNEKRQEVKNLRQIRRFYLVATFLYRLTVLRAFLILVLAGLLGSNGLERAAAESDESAGKTACNVLSVEIVKSVLEVDDLDVTPTPVMPRGQQRRRKTYTSCKLVWPSDKKVEREIAGRKFTVDAENRITLSVSIFEPGEDQQVYNTGTKYLKEKFDTEAVEGVGDEALWVPNMKQLSVRGNGHVFHLSVEYAHNDTDKENAKKLAQQILEKLK